jgi:hypothetical protein
VLLPLLGALMPVADLDTREDPEAMLLMLLMLLMWLISVSFGVIGPRPPATVGEPPTIIRAEGERLVDDGGCCCCGRTKTLTTAPPLVVTTLVLAVLFPPAEPVVISRLPGVRFRGLE